VQCAAQQPTAVEVIIGCLWAERENACLVRLACTPLTALRRREREPCCVQTPRAALLARARPLAGSFVEIEHPSQDDEGEGEDKDKDKDENAPPVFRLTSSPCARTTPKKKKIHTYTPGHLHQR